MNMAHRKHHYSYRRHRNPLGVDSGTIKLAGWGTVGAIVARTVPAMALPSQNSGFTGYLLNFGTAIVASMLAKTVDPGAAEAVLVGGFIGTALRIVTDNFGAKLVGLQGGDALNLGAYITSYFAVPTISNARGQTLNSPYPQLVATPASGRVAGLGSQWGGRFRRGKM